MPIAAPTAIGTNVGGAVAGPTVTTSGAVPANGFIVLCIGWGSVGAVTLNSVAGGSLTWAVDHTQAFAGAIPWGYGVASAQAPAGLASSTVITATFSGAPLNSQLAVAYSTGIVTSSPKDISDGNGASTAAWDTTATTTTFADTLVIGGCEHDGLTTNTASGGATEISDFQNGTDAWSMCTEYKILAATASTSLTGTWATGATNYVAAFVAYKGAATASVPAAYQTYGPRKTTNRAGPFSFIEQRTNPAPISPPATVTVKRLPATGVG